MKEETLEKILKVAGIGLIVAGSFAAYCLMGVYNGCTRAKSQEYYDSLYREKITKNYQMANQNDFATKSF